jgi:hypothetical protein
VLRSRIRDPSAAATDTPSLRVDQGEIVAHCGGGGTLSIAALEIDGSAVTAATLAEICAGQPIPLER